MDVDSEVAAVKAGAGEASNLTTAATPPIGQAAGTEIEEVEAIEAVDVPTLMLRFLTSPFYKDSIKAIQTEFNLTEENIFFIFDLERMVMAGEIDLEAYLVALEEEFDEKLSDAQRDKLYAKLLAEHFVPLGDTISPTALEVAETEGLKLTGIPSYRVYTKPLSYSGAAAEIAKAIGLSLMDDLVRQRLRDLVISQVKGIRKDFEVKDLLMRKTEFGGLGMDAEAAGRAITAIFDILGRAEVLSEEEYEKWLSKESAVKFEIAEPAAAEKLEQAEEEEVGLKTEVPEASKKAMSALEKAVEETFARVQYRPPSDYLVRRLKNAISSRLRDVRSAFEFKQLLMRDSKVGGLKLDASQADFIAQQVEASYAEFHSAILQEEKSRLEQQIGEQERMIAKRKEREAEERAAWFEEKLRSRKAETKKGEAAFKEMTAAGPSAQLMRKERRAENEKFGRLVHPPQAGATQSVPDLQLPSGAASAAKTPAKPAAATGATEAGSFVVAEMAKPGIKVSLPTVELARKTAASRPSLDGIKFETPHLVGLSGELQNMTLAEFRRLARNPQEAAEKIKQKVDLLSAESFEKRIQAIKGYLQSPLQKEYTELVMESFRQGRQVLDFAEEQKNAGKDTLTPEEITAIIQLDSALHF